MTGHLPAMIGGASRLHNSGRVLMFIDDRRSSYRAPIGEFSGRNVIAHAVFVALDMPSDSAHFCNSIK